MDQLKEVKFFINANGFEMFTLWKENKYEPDPRYKVEWEEILAGFSQIVGHVKIGKKNHAVNVAFSFAKLNGVLVCFYHSCSRIVDNTMIEEFLTNNYPIRYDNGTRRAMTDANNFHHCTNALKQL